MTASEHLKGLAERRIRQRKDAQILYSGPALIRKRKRAVSSDPYYSYHIRAAACVLEREKGRGRADARRRAEAALSGSAE